MDNPTLKRFFILHFIIPLVLLVVYGRKVYHQINDKDSNIAILGVSVLFNLAHILIIFYFIRFREIGPTDLQLVDFSILKIFVGFSMLMLLLWVFNVIAFLNRGKWMEKMNSKGVSNSL